MASSSDDFEFPYSTTQFTGQKKEIHFFKLLILTGQLPIMRPLVLLEIIKRRNPKHSQNGLADPGFLLLISLINDTRSVTSGML